MDELILFSLERRLCNVAEHYLTLQQDTVLYSDARPLGVTYGDRTQWLDENILTPARLLDTALSLENQRYLSLFPNLETGDFPAYPAFQRLSVEIPILIDWVSALHQELQNLTSQAVQPRPALKPQTDLKYALVWDLLEIYVATPDPLAKKQRRPALVSQSPKKGVPQQTGGEFLGFVRAAAEPILGHLDELTDQARQAVAKYRKQHPPDAP